MTINKLVTINKLLHTSGSLSATHIGSTFLQFLYSVISGDNEFFDELDELIDERSPPFRCFNRTTDGTADKSSRRRPRVRFTETLPRPP